MDKSIQRKSGCMGLVFSGYLQETGPIGQQSYHEQPHRAKDFLQDERSGCVKIRIHFFFGTPSFFLFLRHHYHAKFLLAIHLHHYRMFKTDVPQVRRFFHHRKSVEEILLVNAITHVGIDGKIAYSK